MGFSLVPEDAILAKLLCMSDTDYVDPTLLHQSVKGRSHLSLIEAVRMEPWALSAQDLCGMTPLHWAVKHGNPEAVRILINLGADPNSKDLDGRTPLHYAAWGNNIPCAVALLDAGAEVNAKNHFGWSPVVYVLQFGTYKMVELLLSRGADINDLQASEAVNDGLFIGFQWEDVEDMARMWQLFVNHGGDLNTVDSGGWTLIQASVYGDNPDAFRVFHQLGARLDVSFSNGETILHTAAIRATSDLFRAMREAQINDLSLHAVDKNGDTPMDKLQWRVRAAKEELGPGVRKPTEEDVAEFEALIRDLEERYNKQLEELDGDSHEAEEDKGTESETEVGWDTASEGEGELSDSG